MGPIRGQTVPVDAAQKPLDGIKILDFTRVLAGPFASRMLSDLGADVVKIEPPEGDMTRKLGVRQGEQSSYFAFANAGKRDICIDLTVAGGPDLARRLAAKSDVVIENFRPDVMASFGLDWATLSADHPDLVMLSISGFGQDGPESHRAAYAGVLHAESGFTLRHGDITGTEPADLQYSVADTTTGLHGVVGLLCALRVRDATGVGQYVDMAMLDALMATDDYVHWAMDGEDAPQGGGLIFETPDGPVIVMGDFKWIWMRASKVLGLEDPTPEGAPLSEKTRLRREAWLDHVASFDDQKSFLAELDRANLAWGLVLSPTEALKSPTLAHRDSIVECDDRYGGTRRVMQSPYRFSVSPSGIGGPAPVQGEHNLEVLTDWLDAGDEHDDLKSRGVLIEPPRE